MSRIHEALKKAEQERAASQGGPAQPDYQPSYATTAAAELPMMPAAEKLPGTGWAQECPRVAASRSTSAMPSFGSPFSLDALLARCVPQPWAPDEKTMLFFNGDDIARGSEEFRTLRSRLYHAREKMPLKKVLVTSALPKEGKSFTAANLAQVLVRQHGRRVLLIDADLRGPRLHMMLGTTFVSGPRRLSAGRKRRILDHAARADGEPVLYSQRSGDFRSRRTGGQWAPEASCCSGWRRCSTGSSSTLRRPCRFLTPACWRRPAMAC